MSKQSILDIRNLEITIYRDHCRFEATSVIVDRVNDNNNVEYQFMFKMRISGRYYYFVHGDESYNNNIAWMGLAGFRFYSAPRRGLAPFDGPTGGR